MTTAEILARLEGVKQSGPGKWMARCPAPAHEDKTQSLAVSTGDAGATLLHCHAGCSTEAVCAGAGLKLADLFAQPKRNSPRSEIVATYDYTDENGELLYQVVRKAGKKFVQRRPARPDDPPDTVRDDWVYSLKGVRRVLYRLPELLSSTKAIVIVEGEKDADRLAALGVAATTCPGGAGKWLDKFSESLRGRHVVILPDNDDPGREHARQVARSLHLVAKTVKILELPGLPPKGDSSDFLDAGGTVEELRQLARAAPEWDPETEPEDRAGTEAEGSYCEERTFETTVPTSPVKEPPPEVEPEPTEAEDDVPWTENGPFRCLGYDHGAYYYLPRESGQIVVLTASQHDRKPLLPLAPLSWWEQTFPHGQGVSWATAADTLFRVSHRVGVFRPQRLRGRGCWPEKGADGRPGILIHLGSQLLPPGAKAFVAPETFKSRFIYERLHHLDGPSMQPLELSEARAILDLFQALRWKDPASAYLAAGFTVLAPVCGALTWRPHVWLCGERGSGKSTVLERLVTPLLADMVLEVSGQTTEAGIRQELRADALAVVFDEAEEDETAGKRIQAVLALARQSSTESGARTLKGTVHGTALQFRIRSMFCLASIGVPVYQEADKSRVSLLTLLGASQIGREERQAHWRQLAPKLDAVSEETGRQLIARTLRLLRSGMLPQSIRVFRSAAAAVLGEARTGDQYGTLYAGAWTLMSDEAPTEAEARELLTTEDLTTYQEDHVHEGKKLLGTILEQLERIDSRNGPRTVAVGELVDICCGRVGQVSAEDADARLRQIGLRVEVEDGAYVLFVANNSEWMKRVLEGTIYARGHRTVLQSLAGVLPGGEVRFHPGLKARTSRVPYSLLD